MRLNGYVLLFLVLFGFVLVVMPRPKFGGHGPGPARIAAAKTQIVNFKTAINLFREESGHFPRNLDDLVVQPKDFTNWQPYLDTKTVPLDPWQHPYIYRFPGRHNTNSFDLISLGPDGREGTEDDIKNWQ